MEEKNRLSKTSLNVLFFREDKYFIAYSPDLDISTYGKSFEEAKRRFSELVELFFEELKEKGTLEEVLTELGWSRKKNSWTPPALIAQYSEEFKIPLQM